MNFYTRNCPLCGGPSRFHAEVSARLYFLCGSCGGVYMGSEFFPSRESEMQRYLGHNNDVRDPGYRRFAEPLAGLVRARFRPGEHRGLDFGAGPGPVLSSLLEESGFEIDRYDPFFFPGRRVLSRRYDFIVACEVIEHFRRPAEDFSLLRGLLSGGGRLVCKTHPLDGVEDFGGWYYAKDPTHFFFYRAGTFETVKDLFGFSGVSVSGRTIEFSA